MAKTNYIGIDGAPKKIGKYYIGVDNAPKKVAKIYVGDVDLVPQLVYEAECKHGNWTETILVTATCTRMGSIEYTCIDCGYSYTASTPMTAHKYIADPITGKTKCRVCGAIGIG